MAFSISFSHHALSQFDPVRKIKEMAFYSRATDNQSFARTRVGYGIPYGFLGANVEVGLHWISIHGGLGYAAVKDIKGAMGYQYGLRFYNGLPDEKLRIRFSASHGTNNYFYEYDQQRKAVGFNIGFGIEHRIEDNISYDMDVIIPINSTNSTRPDNLELENRVFPSFGIGYHF